MQSVTANAVATKIDTVLGDNTFEINQPNVPPEQRKRNNIQEQLEELYSINLLNKKKNGLSIDVNYRDSRITVYKIVNGKAIESKYISLR